MRTASTLLLCLLHALAELVSCIPTDRQPSFVRGGGVDVSVLRVHQCCNHLADGALATHLLPSFMAGAAAPNAKCGSEPCPSPHLAFVLADDLSTLSSFVRSGMRLPEISSSATKESNGLVVTDRLDVSNRWHGLGSEFASASAMARDGYVDAPPDVTAKPALNIWRLVLAICWPDANGEIKKPLESKVQHKSVVAMPAFIIDYAVETVSSQLTT